MPRDKTSLFIQQRDIDYVNDVSTELIELVAQQKIIYYAIDEALNQSDDLYGESIKKVFRNPVEIYCRVFLEKHEVITNSMGSENVYNIEVYFQRDRVMKDLGFYPRIGDFINWANKFFEIKTAIEQQLFGGLSQQRPGILCRCVNARQEIINNSQFKPYDPTIIPDSEMRTP
jgi:hypothetical protein